MKTLKIIDVGTLAYEDTYFLQKRLAREIKLKERDDHIMLAEHPAVFTVGRSGSGKNILIDPGIIRDKGIRVIDVDRGGDVTFHGKGQLVAYPVFDLNKHAKDVRLFIRNLERVLELTVSLYGIAADTEIEHTGLWAGGRKIAFIGIAVTNWVTYHGISINANVDLEYFSMIRPCGIDGLKVTSLREILNRPVDIEALKESLLKKFCEVFGFERLYRYPEDAFMAKEGVAR